MLYLMKKILTALKSLPPFIIIFIVSQKSVFPVSVQMTVNQNEVSESDPVSLLVTVKGAGNSGPPQISNLKGNFDVDEQGTSSQIQIKNGVKSVSKISRFLLYPNKPGNFQIGPARVKINGKTYKSNTINIKVSRARGAENKKSRYFVKADVSQKRPYLNEQIEYTFEFYTKTKVGDAQLSLPGFKEFWKEETQKQQKKEKMINGVSWSVIEVKLALFPTRLGEIMVNPATLTADFVVGSGHSRNSIFDDPFFGRLRQKKRVRLKSNAILLNVRDVPAAGKPKNFSGLVGAFSISSNLSKNQLSVGDSATLTVAISGDGNLRDARLPEVSWENIRIYEDEPKMDLDVSAGRLKGVKTFKLALVPEKEGLYTLSPIQLNYFDPKARQYKTLNTTELAMNVQPGDPEKLSHLTGELAQKKKTIQVLGSDITPIKQDLTILSGETITASLKATLLSLTISLFLVHGFLILFVRRKARLHSDKGYLKREKAYANFKSNVKKISGASSAHEASSILLRNYLGDKLGFDGQALTSADVERKLGGVVHQKLISEIKEFLEKCELGQYGGTLIENSDDISETVLAIGKKFEKEMKT